MTSLLWRAAVWALWLAALAGAWLLLVDTISLAELLAGAGAALLATLATELVRRQRVAPLGAPVAVFASVLPRQLLRVPLDLYLLAVELARAIAKRHPDGRFHALPFEGGAAPHDNSRRGAIELFGSLAPNTIVLGVDENEVVLHQLRAHAGERHKIGELAR